MPIQNPTPANPAPTKIDPEQIKSLVSKINGNIEIANGQVKVNCTIPLDEILKLVLK
jgi:hypothetical protein